MAIYNTDVILEELKDSYNKCSELFDIAFELNQNENTRTAFTKKVTTYMPDLIQTLSFIINNLEDNKSDGVYLDRREYAKLLEYRWKYKNLIT